MRGRPYRVLFVSLFPPRAGGLSVQSEVLARWLAREGVEVVRVNAHREAAGARLGQKAAKGLRQVVGVAGDCRRKISKVDRVLVAGCSWWGFMPVVVGILLARRYGKPVSVLYHGGAAPQFLRFHHRWVRALLNSAHMVAVTSSWLREAFARKHISTIVVPPILDGNFSHQRKRGRKPVFLSNRYLEPIYDVTTILEAFQVVQAAYPQAKLVVAGSGSQQQMLQDFARQRGISATFTGNVAREKMATLLGAADFYLSAARVDNFPLSVLEAMRAGAMVVTTPVGELPHLMVHGMHGLFFAPGDPDSLAKTVLYALEHDDLCERCRQNARELAASFTWERVRHHYLTLVGLGGTRKAALPEGGQDVMVVR